MTALMLSNTNRTSIISLVRLSRISILPIGTLL